MNRQARYAFTLLTDEHQLRVKKGRESRCIQLDMSCNCRRVLDACYFAFLSPSHPASQGENAMTTAVEVVAYRGIMSEKTAWWLHPHNYNGHFFLRLSTRSKYRFSPREKTASTQYQRRGGKSIIWVTWSPDRISQSLDSNPGSTRLASLPLSYDEKPKSCIFLKFETPWRI